MTPKYISSNFNKTHKEIVDALGTPRRHGKNIEFNDKVRKNYDDDTLFDGDDGLFKSLTKDIKTYFEYGCGKSTEFMYRHSNCKIFAVDTSKFWVKKTKNISVIDKDERLNLKWIDVGDIGEWGYPKSFKKRENFQDYANWFWKQNQIPNLVLIDGRFRVFCFLTCLKYGPIGTKIIFDDYINRPHYHLVEEFSTVLDKCGRQALFEVTNKAKEMINDNTLLSFQNVIG